MHNLEKRRKLSEERQSQINWAEEFSQGNKNMKPQEKAVAEISLPFFGIQSDWEDALR